MIQTATVDSTMQRPFKPPKLGQRTARHYVRQRDDARNALLTAMKVIAKRRCRCLTIRPIDLATVSKLASRSVPGARLLIASLRDYEILTTTGCKDSVWFDRYGDIAAAARRAITLYAEQTAENDNYQRLQKIMEIEETRLMSRTVAWHAGNPETNGELENSDRRDTGGF